MLSINWDDSSYRGIDRSGANILLTYLLMVGGMWPMINVWDTFHGQQCVLYRRICYSMNANDLIFNERYGDEY